MISRLLKALPALAGCGKFLHLVEDNLQHVSISGISAWVTLYGTAHATLAQMDWHTQAAAVGASATALAAHTVKRAQMLKAAPADADNIWSGEES